MLLEAGANPNMQLKRRPPYRDVPQDRGGDTILAQGATPLLRAARAGDAPFVELLLKHKALVDLPSKEGVTPLMAAAGVEFGTRVTRGRNRTNEGVLATMKLLHGRGRQRQRAIGDRTAPGGVQPEGASQAAQYALSFRRGSQMPSAAAVPHETALHGAAARRLHAVREVPRRERRRPAGQGCQRQNAARSRERHRGCRPRAGRVVPRNRQAARIADRRKGRALTFA